MKRLLQIALLFVGLAWCVPASAVITVVQSKNVTCAASPCTIGSLSAIGAGHTLLIWGTGATSTAMSAASCSTTCGTMSHCSPSANGNDTTFGAIDCFFILSSTSGGTSASFTYTNTDAGGFIEFSSDLGTMAVDTGGTRDQSTAATSIAGVTLTLTGTSDVIVQFGHAAGTFSAVSAGWTSFGTTAFPNGNGGAYKINTNSGTAPTWTSTSARAALGAFAFKEVAAAGGTSSGFLPLLGVGTVFFGMTGFLFGALDYRRGKRVQAIPVSRSGNGGRLLARQYGYARYKPTPGEIVHVAVEQNGLWIVPTLENMPTRTPVLATPRVWPAPLIN